MIWDWEVRGYDWCAVCDERAVAEGGDVFCVMCEAQIGMCDEQINNWLEDLDA